MANESARCPDALWSDEDAYAYIDELFENENFLSTAQERMQNHGSPVDLKKFESNFREIILRWSVNPPKLVASE